MTADCCQNHRMQNAFFVINSPFSHKRLDKIPPPSKMELEEVFDYDKTRISKQNCKSIA